MATYWVSTLGTDGDGLTYANAKTTLAGGLALLAAKGDILNVVNDATHAWPTSETTLAAPSGGTPASFTDFGYKIRGTDSSGTPAMATIAPAGAGVHRLFRSNANTGYNILENLIFDASAQYADTSVYTIARDGAATALPTLFRYCAVLGGDSGQAAAGLRHVWANVSSASGEVLQCSYCYFQNTGRVAEGAGTYTYTFDHCVSIEDVTCSGSTFYFGQLTTSSTPVKTAIYNTVYKSTGAGATIPAVEYLPNSSIDVGTVNVYGNLFFVNSTHATNILPFFGGNTSTGVTMAGTIDYNVLLGGPDVGGTEGTLNSVGWYQKPWETGGGESATPDGWPHDTIAVGVAEATIFVDTASTYDWVLPNDLTITILKDVRPLAYLTSGYGGGVPGALPAGLTDYTVSIVVDQQYPIEGETLTLTTTISNAGEDASSVVVTVTLPSGLTYVSDTPSAGSFVAGTGVWSAGTLADGASATLAIVATVDSGTASSALTTTAAFTSGAPDTDTSTSDDTDTVIVYVQASGGLDDPDDPDAVPYLDVLPFYADVLVLELNSTLRTTQNRLRLHYLRSDAEDQAWREFATRRISVAASTTDNVVGALEAPGYIMLESDNAVQLSAGASAGVFLPSATMVMVRGGTYRLVQVKNPSSTDAAITLITEVD